MQYPYTEKFMQEHKAFLLENLMGPNSVRVSEELAASLTITPDMRILDLGCGTGLSSIFLAEHFGCTVFAADLWINPSDNHKRFQQRTLDHKIIPLHLDVNAPIPFADEYFDLIFCVDAYHYFGYTEAILPILLNILKPNGHIAVGMPGVKAEFTGGTPVELREFLPDNHHFHTVAWWQNLWGQNANIEILSATEMQCHDQAWQEWLESPNPYAQNDIKMIAAEGGQYFNHIQLIAKRIK